MNKILYVLLLILVATMLSACTTTSGHLGDKSHFTYPNSNVKPIGPVSAEVTKFGAFSIAFSKEDIRKVFNEALSKQAGADLIINYKLDTKFTQLGPLPLFMSTMSIEGTAAKMTVGLKELKELKSIY